MTNVGDVVVLNGVPRSGKSSIVEAIQESFDGAWMNLGVDVFCRRVTPARYQPGIGLRPGGERADLEALVPPMYAALYDSIAAHSRQGLNVVSDVGHHDAYSRPLHILRDAGRRLDGLPALLVGVRCPVEEIMTRREQTWGEVRDPDGAIPEHVLRWQREVHTPGIYDMEVDTSRMTAAECAAAIRERLDRGPEPSAFRQLAARE